MGGYFSAMETQPPTDSLDHLIRRPDAITVAGFHLEQQLLDMGYQNIAGIDEAGRGPLAGPVVASAVILSADNIPDGLNDSKKLSAANRESLFNNILDTSIVAIATASARTIDHANIRQATLMCMENAWRALDGGAEWSLVDGRDVPPLINGKASAVIGGDGYSQSIAAASIIAKVFRDRLMREADKSWPQYGFDKHKGYGTKFHMDAIAQHGPCPLHRMTFAPLSSERH